MEEEMRRHLKKEKKKYCTEKACKYVPLPDSRNLLWLGHKRTAQCRECIYRHKPRWGMQKGAAECRQHNTSQRETGDRSSRLVPSEVLKMKWKESARFFISFWPHFHFTRPCYFRLFLHSTLPCAFSEKISLTTFNGMLTPTISTSPFIQLLKLQSTISANNFKKPQKVHLSTPFHSLQFWFGCVKNWYHFSIYCPTHRPFFSLSFSHKDNDLWFFFLVLLYRWYCLDCTETSSVRTSKCLGGSKGKGGGGVQSPKMHHAGRSYRFTSPI